MTDETDLYIFSFVCHETSAAARSSQWSFYTDLASHAKPNAVFIIADVKTHSRRVLDEIMAAFRRTWPSWTCHRMQEGDVSAEVLIAIKLPR